MLGFCVGYQLKPGSYIVRILAKGSLVVVLAIELHFKLRAALNERTGPVYANLAQIALSAQRISHISYVCEPGRESTLNEVKNMLSNYVLLKLSKIH
jgi:hypothetical protein